MDEIKAVRSLLEAVIATMDTIPVLGFDNMDKFVGCGIQLRNASNLLTGVLQEDPKEGEDVNG